MWTLIFFFLKFSLIYENQNAKFSSEQSGSFDFYKKCSMIICDAPIWSTLESSIMYATHFYMLSFLDLETTTS